MFMNAMATQSSAIPWNLSRRPSTTAPLFAPGAKPRRSREALINTRLFVDGALESQESSRCLSIDLASPVIGIRFLVRGWCDRKHQAILHEAARERAKMKTNEVHDFCAGDRHCGSGGGV